jgi:hypothetical protein
LNGDQWTRLLRADPGGWSRADIDRVLAELGWHLRPDDVDPYNEWRLRVAADGPLEVTADLQNMSGYGGRFGEFVQIDVTRRYPVAEVEAAAAAVIAEVVAVLGPPPMVGGPGPWARWRLPTTIVEVRQDGPLMDHPTGRVWLSVLPRDAAENFYSWTAKWSPDWQPGYLWRVSADGPPGQPLHGMMSYRHPAAETIERFEDNLRSVFHSAAGDIGVLQPYVADINWVVHTADRTRFVQGSFAADLCTFDNEETSKLMAQNDGELFGVLIEAPFDGAAGLRIADLTIAEIRTWGVDDPRELRAEAWCHGPPGSLDAFGLGLAPESRSPLDEE